jgi:putative flippase GtrA
LNRVIEKIFVFAKAQLSAFFGGIVDYLTMIFFTEVFGVHYTISIAIGGIVGAIVNFSINRKWTFHVKNIAYKSSHLMQISKFLIVLLNSIVMKSAGTFFFTSFFRIDYKISRIITDLIVSLIFNFTLQKHWVFRKEKQKLEAKGIDS